MCGICGIINFDASHQVDIAELVRMRDIMTHRGPDDAGVYIDGSVGLGHRRLSIIDVEGGHQPIWNEDNTICVVSNGEIYNFKSIRNELLQRGHKFSTDSDTEVLIHLYEDYNTSFLHKLQGMFSFGIWDSRNNKLFAARDRLGIKPFYYLVSDNRLLFASEIKAILQCRGVTRELNPDVLPEYLIFRFVAGEETLFKGIKSLLPGHALICRRGNITVFRYWTLKVGASEELNLSYSKSLGRLDELLEQSVNRRLISDVPLGTLNSGGVDSSLVTAYTSEKKSDLLNTYSVGLDEPEYDESFYASIIADKFKTRHHSLVVNRMEFARELPLCTWYNDEPLNHANSVLIYLICKLAKKNVTVVLTGEGADEVFGGYPRYYLLMLQQWFPRIIRRFIALACTILPGHYPSKIKDFLPMSDHESLLLNSSFVLPQSIQNLFEELIHDLPFPFRISAIQDVRLTASSLVDKGLFLDLQTYLVSILHRMDRMSMAAGVEARVPFLDHELVELAMTLPYQWKLNLFDYKTKSILKKLARKRLPKKIVLRKKAGFGVPLSEWLRDSKGLSPYLCLLTGKKFKERGIFRPKTVEGMVYDHLKGNKDYSDLLWALINLELWFQLFIDRVTSQNDLAEVANEIMDAKPL